MLLRIDPFQLFLLFQECDYKLERSLYKEKEKLSKRGLSQTKYFSLIAISIPF